MIGGTRAYFDNLVLFSMTSEGTWIKVVDFGMIFKELGWVSMVGLHVEEMTMDRIQRCQEWVIGL